MDDGRLMRRSKLKYLLVRKGLADDAVEEFVNEDVEDILRLFRVFNDGTHGAAGRFSLDELVAVNETSALWDESRGDDTTPAAPFVGAVTTWPPAAFSSFTAMA